MPNLQHGHLHDTINKWYEKANHVMAQWARADDLAKASVMVMENLLSFSSLSFDDFVSYAFPDVPRMQSLFPDQHLFPLSVVSTWSFFS